MNFASGLLNMTYVVRNYPIRYVRNVWAIQNYRIFIKKLKNILDFEIVSALPTQLIWTHNLEILSQTKTI